jgi:hypothetical protein
VTAAGLSGPKLERYLYRDCMKLARATRERTGWPLAAVSWDENHFGVEMPDGQFLDAAVPHRDYDYERYDPALVEGCDCGCLPDDEARADAGRLLSALGIHLEPEQ